MRSPRPSLACGSIHDSLTLAFEMVLMPGTPLNGAIPVVMSARLFLFLMFMSLLSKKWFLNDFCLSSLTSAAVSSSLR